MAPLGIDDSKWPEVMRQARKIAAYMKNTAEYMPTEHPLLRFVRNPGFQALLAYIRKHSKEIVARGALADWLEENGESEYAAYIRYECGIWQVTSGYNYNKYKEKINYDSESLFATQDATRSGKGISTSQQLGLLREVQISSLDNWLTFGKLAYAVGCVRRVEIVGTLFPISLYENTVWTRTRPGDVIYGYLLSNSIFQKLYERILIETAKPIYAFDYEHLDNFAMQGRLIRLHPTQTDQTQTKLLKAISSAAILHAKHSAIADGIACE